VKESHRAGANPTAQEVSQWQCSQSAVNTRETHSLIASDKVEGTPVYRSNGEQVGEIDRVMIDKRSGKVAFAVMSFGGFLGIGEDYYLLPWSLLIYNERLGGYEVNITEQQLKGAPHYSQHQNWNWEDQSRTNSVNTYYGQKALV
jgi:sporulation protein YlmC with PRC-barrel domain